MSIHYGGEMILAGWIGETPDGSEAAYILLNTPDPAAATLMALIAVTLGLDPTPGSVTLDVDPAVCWVDVAEDMWMRVRWPGGYYTAPGGECAEMIRRQGRAVLVVGLAPDEGTDAVAYIRRHHTRVCVGVVAARNHDQGT